MNKLNVLENDKIGRSFTFEYLKKHLKKSDTVLDVGSGTCMISEMIKKKIGAKVRCIDVIDINTTNMPLKIFDGEKIPFKANSFSVVLCSFVLHHSKNPVKLIKEMKRVSKSRIIILEDIPETFFDKILILGHILWSKIRYRSGIMKFYNIAEWKKLFKQNKLKIEEIVEIDKSMLLWYPVTRRMFVLRKR